MNETSLLFCNSFMQRNCMNHLEYSFLPNSLARKLWTGLIVCLLCFLFLDLGFFQILCGHNSRKMQTQLGKDITHQ